MLAHAAFDTTFAVQGAQGTISVGRNDAFGTTFRELEGFCQKESVSSDTLRRRYAAFRTAFRVRGAEGNVSGDQNRAFGTVSVRN